MNFNIVNEVRYNVYADLRQSIFASLEVTSRKSIRRDQMEKGLSVLKDNLLEVKQRQAALKEQYRAGTGLGSIHQKLELDRLYLVSIARERGLGELLEALQVKDRVLPGWVSVTFAELIKLGLGAPSPYYLDRNELSKARKEVKAAIEFRTSTLNDEPLREWNRNV